MATISKKNMFNEATRVQMPAMVHLTRLGYTYFGKITEDMAGTVYDPDSGIEPGTAFEDIPEDWVCPVCGVGKDDFEPYEE